MTWSHIRTCLKWLYRRWKRKSKSKIHRDLRLGGFCCANVSRIYCESFLITNDSICSLQKSQETDNTSEILEQRFTVVAPRSVSSTPTPSLEEEEDEMDDFVDESDEFSFYKFSVRYFQDSADNRHTPQRLKTPLLAHEDEGDALVRGQDQRSCRPRLRFLTHIQCLLSLLQACLTLSWIILRFMGDIPEPKAMDTISQLSTNISREGPRRQARRLSSLVGLDQVNYCKMQTYFLKRKREWK